MRAKPKLLNVNINNKKFLFKLIMNTKGEDGMTNVDKLWKSYMMAPDEETTMKGKPLVENKAHLITILKELHEENLVMYVPEDGKILPI